MEVLAICLAVVGVSAALVVAASELSGIRRALERIADQQEQ